MAELKCALEDIIKMKKKFSQSSGLFDALSFYLCVLYSNLIIYHTEIPNKFIDKITLSLMEYPVKLPDNNTVDLSTITRSRKMQRYINPFTNENLTEDDLVPQEDLCKLITEWKVKTLASHKIKKEYLECVLLD